MESTRAYYMSHILLRNEIFFNQKVFFEKLKNGPIEMKKYLSDLWNSIDEKNFKEGVIIKDISRVVNEDSFNITMRQKEDKTIFFFIMPEPDSYDAQAKAVALILEKNKIPRYITMEIWTENEINKQYTMGEWVIENQNFLHLNLEKIPRETIECFATYLEEKLSK